jgi:hypothetical protein
VVDMPSQILDPQSWIPQTPLEQKMEFPMFRIRLKAFDGELAQTGNAPDVIVPGALPVSLGVDLAALLTGFSRWDLIVVR